MDDPVQDSQDRHHEDCGDHVEEKARGVGVKGVHREHRDQQCHRIGEFENREVLLHLWAGVCPVLYPTPGMAYEQYERGEEKKLEEKKALMPLNIRGGDPKLEATLRQDRTEKGTVAILRRHGPPKRHAGSLAKLLFFLVSGLLESRQHLVADPELARSFALECEETIAERHDSFARSLEIDKSGAHAPDQFFWSILRASSFSRACPQVPQLLDLVECRGAVARMDCRSRDERYEVLAPFCPSLCQIVQHRESLLELEHGVGICDGRLEAPSILG